jgi:hypothetical protein
MATQTSEKTQHASSLLNVHTRYDRPLKKKDVLPHYPKQIKTVYTKDYIPSDANVSHTITTVELPTKTHDGAATKLKNVPAVRTAYNTEFVAKKGQPDHREEIYARFKKTHPGGDLLNKNSEYEKKYGPHSHPQDQFERPSVKLAAWQKVPLPVESISTAMKTFTPQPFEKAGLISTQARADFVNVYHRNRNGQVVGHKYDPLSKHTDYRAEYPKRTQSASVWTQSGTVLGRVAGPHPPVESSTDYRRQFVDHHVRHSQLAEE